jgi:integrase
MKPLNINDVWLRCEGVDVRWIGGGMDTRYLEQRRQGWYAVLDVPPKLRSAVGRKRLRVSLKTRDLGVARTVRWKGLEQLRQRLAQHASDVATDAAMDRLTAAGLNARDAFQRLERGDLSGFSVVTSQDAKGRYAEPESALGIAYEGVEQSRDEITVRDGAAAAAVFWNAAHGQPITTFQAAAGEYIATHRAGWRNPRHAMQWESTLARFVFPVIGDLPPGDIGTSEVMKVLTPMWREVPETGSRVRGRIEAVLDYCTSRGWRRGDNPARWKGHLEHLLPKVGKVAHKEHHPAMPWREVPGFMARLREQDGSAASALQFLVLTAARTGEVIGAVWAEIDMAGRVWTVPAARMKAGREHRVPLSDAAVEVLRSMQERRQPRHGEWVFPATFKARKGLYVSAMTDTLGRVPGVGGRSGGVVTVHGFRSSFRDWIAEATDYSGEVAEAALAHTNGNRVEAAYRRSDLFERRRALMDAWAAWCMGDSGGGMNSGRNVVPANGARVADSATG